MPLACAAAGLRRGRGRGLQRSRGGAGAGGLPARLPWRTAQRAGISLTEAMRRYSNHHVELVRVLLASAGVQVIRVLQACCLGRALGIDLPLGDLLPPHPGRPARHAAADHGERPRHEPGRVPVPLRPGRRARAAGRRALGPLRRARHRRQPAGRPPLRVRRRPALPAQEPSAGHELTTPRGTRRR